MVWRFSGLQGCKPVGLSAFTSVRSSAYSTIGLKVYKSLNLQVFKLNSTAKRGVVSNRGELLHRTNTLTQLEENSDDHTYDGENRARFKEGNQSIAPASKHRYECVGQVGCRCGIKGASLLPKRRRPAPYFSETATGVPQVFPSRPPVSTAWANAGWKLSTTALTGRGRE